MNILKIGELINKPTGLVTEATQGDPIYVFQESLDLSKYTDITSNDNWIKVGLGYYDYLFARNQIIMHTATNPPFSGLSQEDRKVAAKHFAVGATDRLDTFKDSDLQGYWNTFVEKAQRTREARWKMSKGYISYVLPMGDSIHIAQSTNELTNSYITYGIESLAIDGVDGLFDWVENTGSYSGGTGFSGQTYWTQTYQDNLSSILRNGYK